MAGPRRLESTLSPGSELPVLLGSPRQAVMPRANSGRPEIGAIFIEHRLIRFIKKIVFFSPQMSRVLDMTRW